MYLKRGKIILYKIIKIYIYDRSSKRFLNRALSICLDCACADNGAYSVSCSFKKAAILVRDPSFICSNIISFLDN